MESQTFKLMDGTEVCVIPTETILIRQKTDVVMLTSDQLMEIFLRWKRAGMEANEE